MKADRLMSLLLMLQSADRRTAGELAVALEVSQRTIYRDVEALGAAGVPVYAERGPEGGIALSPGYRRALTHFAEEEIRALFVSNSAVLADLGLGRGLDRALDKLRGALSDVQRRAAEKARGRIHIDQRRWNQSDQPREKLALLHRAVWDERRIELCYEDRKRERSRRLVEPFGLVSKAGVWYLVANTSEGFRSFRADRIVEVIELAERFERPANFDLDRQWREMTAWVRERPRDFIATLRVAADSIEDICAYWPSERLDPDDPLLVRVGFSSQEAAVRSLMLWGRDVDVIDAPELCAAVVAHAREILKRYEAPPSKRRRRS